MATASFAAAAAAAVGAGPKMLSTTEVVVDSSTAAAGAATAAADVSRTFAVSAPNKRADSVEAGEVEEEGKDSIAHNSNTNNNDNSSSNSNNNALNGNSNYYHRLDGLTDGPLGNGQILTANLAEQMAVDEAGEKMLMSEIEKFRLRQLQRDR